jgi:hypothetical protein
MNTLVWPTVLYGSEVWRPGLLDFDWSSTKRVHTTDHPPSPHYQVQADSPPAHHPHRFWCSPLSAQDSVWPHLTPTPLRSFTDTTKGQNWYPYLAYRSSKSLASISSLVRSQCQYVGVSDLLAFIGITMDRLPPFIYSLVAPSHLLPT